MTAAIKIGMGDDDMARRVTHNNVVSFIVGFTCVVFKTVMSNVATVAKSRKDGDPWL